MASLGPTLIPPPALTARLLLPQQIHLTRSWALSPPVTQLGSVRSTQAALPQPEFQHRELALRKLADHSGGSLMAAGRALAPKTSL